jgi:hypothetical protein
MEEEGSNTQLACKTEHHSGRKASQNRVYRNARKNWPTIIVVNMRKPHLMPLHNCYSHLVYSASEADVSTSIIHGKIVMWGRRLLTLAPAEIICEVNTIARPARRCIYGGLHFQGFKKFAVILKNLLRKRQYPDDHGRHIAGQQRYGYKRRRYGQKLL